MRVMSERAVATHNKKPTNKQSTNDTTMNEEVVTTKKSEAAVPPIAQSRLPEIWAYYTAQLDRLDDLEKRLDEKETRCRRRITNLLDQTPSYRKSHLRLFLTHKNEQTPKNIWTLVIEGKLLVGLLDHKRAAQLEKEGAWSSQQEPSSYIPTAATHANSKAAAKARAAKEEATMTSRERYRAQGETEEDPVEPIFFTHFFDKLQVVIQTIYQPKTTTPPAQSSLTPPNKSRKRKQADKQEATAPVHTKDLKASDPTKIVWNKTHTEDADAFVIHYSDHYSERPPPPGMKFHSIVATVTLHPTRPETMYQPSQALAENFFPRHIPVDFKARAEKRRRMETGEPEQPPPIALDNDIRVPSLLTMKDITMALYRYIVDKNLQDANDKSLIVFDKVLSNLLECESMNFSDLQQALLTKNLVVPVGPDDEPIVLTYVMKKETTSPQQPLSTLEKKDAEEQVGHHNQVLSFDTDVAVPSYFHYRSRELMRKIKRREYEYTSSRTKARYLLVASKGNEDIIKSKIEQVISGQGFAAENIPIFLALARAAPPNSEARAAAQIDAKTCALVERLEECSRKAEAAWDLVDACRGLTTQK